MTIKPLSKKIYTKAKELGIETIVLNFSGGDDQGYLEVGMTPKFIESFATEIEDWVWETYDYSGAGDGNAYGDNVEYNLVNGTASTEEWYMTRQSGDGETRNLQISAED
jgi:hypothetical protein